jgi:hypothetical protein
MRPLRKHIFKYVYVETLQRISLASQHSKIGENLLNAANTIVMTARSLRSLCRKSMPGSQRVTSIAAAKITVHDVRRSRAAPP